MSANDPSGHKSGSNPASQQSPATPFCGVRSTTKCKKPQLPQPFPDGHSGATYNLLFVTILPNDSSHSQFQKAEKMSNHFTGLSLGPPLGDQKLLTILPWCITLAWRVRLPKMSTRRHM